MTATGAPGAELMSPKTPTTVGLIMSTEEAPENSLKLKWVGKELGQVQPSHELKHLGTLASKSPVLGTLGLQYAILIDRSLANQFWHLI